jgi:hypothetical protein
MRSTNLFIGVILLSFTIFINCQENRKKIKLSSFFKTVNWYDFNKNTFKRNNLSHMLKDSVDFYQRESFFAFMSSSDEKITYQNFYMIEINQTGERDISKKILVINNGNEITYLGFKKGINWSAYQITDEEKNKFQYNKLKNDIKEINQSYLMITKVTELKY